nr:hemolysin family protein [uncultured Blautia sp.]
MDDGSRWPLWGLIILALLILLNGIFYGFAAAVRNISQTEIQKMAAEGDKKAGLLKKLLDEPARYVNAIPLIVTASGIFIGVFLVPMLAKMSRGYIDHFPALLLISVLCVMILASFGILMFRRIGNYRSLRYAFRYIRLVNAVVTVLWPLTVLITSLARMTAVLFGVGLREQQEAVTEEEIISIVDEAHEQGVIEKNEAEMIQNIISFNETKVGDIMTHRTSVVAFDQERFLKDVIDEMLEEGNSRYPVYAEDLDDIQGLIHYKDALKFMTQNPWAKFKPLKELPGLIRKADFIPESGSISNLFRTMQLKQTHMAVVVDEYGQTQGVITMEDILEEIVGEILDEYDEDEDIAIQTQTDNSILIDGFAELEDVEEELGISFGKVEVTTLNGFLTDVLGHIPTEADLEKELVANGYRFKIISLGHRTIGKVRAEKINK